MGDVAGKTATSSGLWRQVSESGGELADGLIIQKESKAIRRREPKLRHQHGACHDRKYQAPNLAASGCCSAGTNQRKDAEKSRKKLLTYQEKFANIVVNRQ